MPDHGTALTTEELAVGDFRIDPERLNHLAQSLAPGYATAQPFAHTVIDDLLPVDVASALVAEFPTPDSHRWHTYRNAREQKLMASNDALMPPAIRHALRELNSSTFINFLETLTGIDGLIPDPHLLGGGMHQIQRGGYLRVHADFSHHPRLALRRRLNVLVYLNPGWEEAYGGHLELWSRDMSQCATRILPVFNRCVVFSTTKTSFHGHPSPLPCPDDVTRRSLALYYYTSEPGGNIREHSTLFRRVPGERVSLAPDAILATTKTAIRRVVPHAVVATVRGVRRRVSDRRPGV
jgi:Rps23 Pro-64 3,4-dihydroxylase Tpa1-like proline 4-hydroxylase